MKRILTVMAVAVVATSVGCQSMSTSNSRGLLPSLAKNHAARQARQQGQYPAETAGYYEETYADGMPMEQGMPMDGMQSMGGGMMADAYAGCADGCGAGVACGDSCSLGGACASAGACGDGCGLGGGLGSGLGGGACACGGAGCNLCARLHGAASQVGQVLHRDNRYDFNPGPPVGQVAYPYYTVRGPRDFLMRNPPPIGP